MARPLLPDSHWAEIAPLLPLGPANPKGGRPRTCDRAALAGILFVLRSDTPWELLPREMSCGSGMTCSRRIRDGQKAGVWDPLQQALLDRLGRRNGIARRGIESSQSLGRYRWVVERTLAWFAQFRRLAIRYERRADIYLAFTTLAAALIVWRFIERWF